MLAVPRPDCSQPFPNQSLIDADSILGVDVSQRPAVGPTLTRHLGMQGRWLWRLDRLQALYGFLNLCHLAFVNRDCVGNENRVENLDED